MLNELHKIMPGKHGDYRYFTENLHSSPKVKKIVNSKNNKNVGKIGMDRRQNSQYHKSTQWGKTRRATKMTNVFLLRSTC